MRPPEAAKAAEKAAGAASKVARAARRGRQAGKAARGRQSQAALVLPDRRDVADLLRVPAVEPTSRRRRRTGRRGERCAASASAPAARPRHREHTEAQRQRGVVERVLRRDREWLQVHSSGTPSIGKPTKGYPLNGNDVYCLVSHTIYEQNYMLIPTCVLNESIYFCWISCIEDKPHGGHACSLCRT